jgi:hypothetical protein
MEAKLLDNHRTIAITSHQTECICVVTFSTMYRVIK